MYTSGISHYMWVHQTLQRWEEAKIYHCKETYRCAEGWSWGSFSLQHVCRITSKLDTSAELMWIFINTIELSVSNPGFNLSLNLLSPPMPSFSGICEVKISLTNLRMKCYYSAFNAQGPKLIIIVVQLGAVKIYVAAVVAHRKKERQDVTQFTTQRVPHLYSKPSSIFSNSSIPAPANVPLNPKPIGNCSLPLSFVPRNARASQADPNAIPCEAS